MRMITLRGTEISTSALGFGCAGLTSVNDRRRAVRLLHAALDAGITHFDVARVYGFGHAEALVGEFMAGRRDSVTVTTKFGLQPPTGLVTGNARIAAIARAVVRRFPPVARRIKARAATMVATGAFTPDAAARSLEKSLSELRTDHVDFLLLHEATLADARRDDLLAFLADQVARGTARYVGIGSSSDKIGDDVSRFPAQYRLFQFENTICEPRLACMQNSSQVAVITHSALKPLGALYAAANHDRSATSEWSERIGLDLTSRSALARLLLGWAVSENADGVTLFSTTRVENLHENIAVAAAAAPRTETLACFEQFVSTLVSKGILAR